MLKDEVKKIKTLLDFEEVADDFTEALLELDLESTGEESGKHGMITWTEFSPEQLDDFASMVWDTAEAICHTLIGKNIKYRGAYWWVRKACKEKYGDSSIPYFVHSFEKTLRSGCPGDTEDAQLDKVGYELLEYVCQKLEEKWESGKADEQEPEFDNCFEKFKHDVRAFYEEDPDEERLRCSESQHASRAFEETFDDLPTIDPDMPLDEPEPVPEEPVRTCANCGKPLTRNAVKFCDINCQREWEHKPNGKFCVWCGKPLIGRQGKYCSKNCLNAVNNQARYKLKPNRTCIQCGKPLTGKQVKFCSEKCCNDWAYVHEYESRTCAVCGRVFERSVKNHAKTCSNQCALELRAATIQKMAADRRWKESQEKKANNWLESE